MFLYSKYSRWYFSIVRNAKNRCNDGYVERHHIVPRSLGGSNSKKNIVCLTAREHFIAHLLLVKMVTGHNKIRMAWALHRMAFSKNAHHERQFSSRQFNAARRAFSTAITGRVVSLETALKISASHKGKILSASHRENIAITSRGRRMTEENKQRLSRQRGEHSARSKTWTLLCPSGREYVTKAMTDFCAEHKLSYSVLRYKAQTRNTAPIKSGPSKGWSVLSCV